MQQVKAKNGVPPLKVAAAVHVASTAEKANLTARVIKELLDDIRRLWQQPVPERPVWLPTAAANRWPFFVDGGGRLKEEGVHEECEQNQDFSRPPKRPQKPSWN